MNSANSRRPRSADGRMWPLALHALDLRRAAGGERVLDGGNGAGGRVLDADENLAVRDLGVVERGGAPRDARRDEQGHDGGDDAAEHGQLEHDDQIRPPRDDGHVAGRQRPGQFRHPRQPRRDDQADASAGGGNPEHPRRLVPVPELVLLERLGRDDHDLRFRQTGRAQAVNSALDVVRFGEETVERLHGFALATAGSGTSGTGCPGAACSPTLSSHTEMMGTSFANSVYRSIIAANVATVMMISTVRGRYCPHAYGRYLWLSDGTTMRNRSSHMPTRTPNEATTQPAIVRSFFNDRIVTGRTKLQTTIVQNSGAKEPRCVTQKTFISLCSLPYQMVSRSAKTKYAHRRLIIRRSLPRFWKCSGCRYSSRWRTFLSAAMAMIRAAMPLKIAPATKYGPNIVECHIGPGAMESSNDTLGWTG